MVEEFHHGRFTCLKNDDDDDGEKCLGKLMGDPRMKNVLVPQLLKPYLMR
jgi:hypothetical protein